VKGNSATDSHWECSRCQSFGTVAANEIPHCECDETEDQLRSTLARVTEALSEACSVAERFAMGAADPAKQAEYLQRIAHLRALATKETP